MRCVLGVTLIVGIVALSPSFAQPPPRPAGPCHEREPARDASYVSRLLSFDQDRNDRLTKSEVTDVRIPSLFGRADEDIVTKVELVAFLDQESRLLAQAGGRGGPGRGGPGGGSPGGGSPGGGSPGGGGPRGGGIGGGGIGGGGRLGGQGGGPGSGQGGPGGRGLGGPKGGQGQQAAQNGLSGNASLGMQSRPCEVMPQQLQAALNLTADQRQQLDQIQQDVDARIAKVLNEQQIQQLRQLGVQAGAPNRGNRPPPNQGDQQPQQQQPQKQQKQN